MPQTRKHNAKTQPRSVQPYLANSVNRETNSSSKMNLGCYTVMTHTHFPLREPLKTLLARRTAVGASMCQRCRQGQCFWVPNYSSISSRSQITQHLCFLHYSCTDFIQQEAVEVETFSQDLHFSFRISWHFPLLLATIKQAGTSTSWFLRGLPEFSPNFCPKPYPLLAKHSRSATQIQRELWATLLVWRHSPSPHCFNTHTKSRMCPKLTWPQSMILVTITWECLLKVVAAAVGRLTAIPSHKGWSCSFRLDKCSNSTLSALITSQALRC